jgi:membrane-bound metal-dependent hydrolase YbcI (DUF457 family)
LLLRRSEPIRLSVGLAVGVLVLDSLWALVAGSPGRFAYAFVDLPAHAAVCGVALLALASTKRVGLSRSFVIAALIASVAIDLDHVPGYLGSQLLGGNLPRPDTHGMLPIVVLAGIGAVIPRGRLRPIALGIAFGLAAHLVRDLATGPGVPLAWPLSGRSATIPYAVFAGGLVLAAVTPIVARFISGRRLRPGIAAALGLAIALTLLPARGAEATSKTPISLGAYIKGADREPAQIEAYAQEVGRKPVIVSIYKNWGDSVFESEQLTNIWERGAVPMITWEPWDENEVGAPLWAIAEGQYDRYIEAEARSAASWGSPLFVRFAHEMNGNWYPWGWGIDGNTPAAFKAAWRHVVGIFRAKGATNVRWVWCPYASNSHPNQFRRFYPGDKWVDWAGLDGFNWGTHSVWQSFPQIFAEPYERVARVTSRPIMIGEVGAAESGGDKARWISRSFGRALPRYRHVRALVWFDSADGRANFRVDSSEASLAAIRRVFAGRLFNSSRNLLLSTPARIGPRHHRRRRHHR